MGFVDPRASTVAQNKISICRALLTLGAVIIAGLMAVSSRAADFHTNATFNATFSLPGVAQNTTSIPNVPLFTLSNLWTIAPSNEPGSLITPDGANQGAIAYNAFSNQLYLVSRSSPTESNYVIYALTTITSISEAVTNISDGVTNISEAVTNVPGTVVSMLNTNGIYNGGAVGEGGIGLASIGVADDGAIYAC